MLTLLLLEILLLLASLRVLLLVLLVYLIFVVVLLLFAVLQTEALALLGVATGPTAFASPFTFTEAGAAGTRKLLILFLFSLLPPL